MTSTENEVTEHGVVSVATCLYDEWSKAFTLSGIFMSLVPITEANQQLFLCFISKAYALWLQWYFLNSYQSSPYSSIITGTFGNRVLISLSLYIYFMCFGLFSLHIYQRWQMLFFLGRQNKYTQRQYPNAMASRETTNSSSWLCPKMMSSAVPPLLLH